MSATVHLQEARARAAFIDGLLDHALASNQRLSDENVELHRTVRRLREGRRCPRCSRLKKVALVVSALVVMAVAVRWI